MVKVGITSVKGSISSKKAMIVPLVPPKSKLNKNAEMGAQTMSIHSPMPGMTYDSIPIKSMSMHSHSGGSGFLLSTCVLFCIGSCVCMVVSCFACKSTTFL